MKKLDLNNEITTKAIEYGTNVICCMEDGQPHPPLRESDVYKTIIEFFQNSTYLVKNGSSKKKLEIQHPKYFPIKIAEDVEKCSFHTYPTISTDDSLEVRIVKNFPVLSKALNKEFKIIAVRKGNSNKYKCTLINYNNEVIYSKN